MWRVRLQVAVVMVVGVLLLGACSSSQQPDDKAITSEIQGKLFEDPALKTRDIRVDAQKGVVVLSGSVATELEKASVERLAGQASGVKQVINQLAVAAPTSAAPETAATEAPPQPKAATREAQRSRRHSGAAQASSAPSAETAPEAPLEAPQQAAAPPPSAPPAPPQPVRVTVPAGTVVTVRMIDSIDSARNRPGEQFAASLEAPIVVGDRVAVPRGADARVRLVEAKSAGRMTGSSELQIELVSLTVNGNPYNVESGYYVTQGASRGKRTAETVGGGAGLGALIGAIAGKGKGAAIGAAIGAGAGTAAQAATHGQQVKVPSETKLDFTIKTAFTITL
jgi:BON domain-containing protein